MESKAQYHHKLFCGRYSTDGNVFLSACQGLLVCKLNISTFHKIPIADFTVVCLVTAPLSGGKALVDFGLRQTSLLFIC